MSRRSAFFKDRYFPTGAGDIFKANEVLTEYRSGDRKLAAFVDQKAGDIPIGRRSYEVHSYKPAYIAPSRLLTLDELTKRGFGEALYPGMDEAQRAARLLADDMNDMENRIARREEWMAAETMIGNGCVMQEYIDGATKGDSLVVKFYDGTSDHTYTASKKWNENGGDFWGDVKAMCRMLSARGLPAKDLILGTDVADYILTDERTRQLLDKNSGIIVGEIRQQLTQYDGVVFMGTLNFGGFMLNVFSVDETYEDETGKSARYFPATAAMVTAPDCGHMMYGSITQMDYGKTDYTTYAAKRVAKLVVDQDKDTRKLRLGCRPLAAPKTYCPTSMQLTLWAKRKEQEYEGRSDHSGGYGFRAKAGAPTKLILAGEVVCVDDAEAERLVKLGVAAEAELDAETKAIVEQADADSNDVETQEEASEAEEKPGRKGSKTAAE